MEERNLATFWLIYYRFARALIAPSRVLKGNKKALPPWCAGWSVRFRLLCWRFIQRRDVYLRARRILVVKHAASIVSKHDFAVVVRQDIVMRQHIIDRLEQVYQICAAMVAPEETASYVAGLRYL